MKSPLEIASGYHSRGWSVTPVAYRGKKAILPEWQKSSLTESELQTHFGSTRRNIGVLNGQPSGDLVDVDLDCVEALHLAAHILPPSGAVFGRASKPDSHWLYRGQLKTKQFKDPTTGTMVLELRSTGTQTVLPGSVHESGEPIEWSRDGEPNEVAPDRLSAVAGRLAGACLMSRYWPKPGGRHDAQLTVIGWLIRSGWSVDEVAIFVAHIVGAAGGDPDVEKRQTTARDAAARLMAGEPVRGFPSVVELFGERTAKTIAKWLGIDVPRGTPSTPRPSPAMPTTMGPSAGAAEGSTLLLGSDVEIATHTVSKLKKRFGEVIYTDGRHYAYQSSHWVEIDPDELRTLVRSFDGATYPVGKSIGHVRLGRRRIDSILFEAASMLAQPGYFDSAPVGINCMSGLIVVDADGSARVEPHMPYHRQRHVLPGRYPVDITEARRNSSLLSTLLDGCFKGDADATKKQFLCAEIAASGTMGIATRLKSPKAAIFFGPKAENGKTQMLELFRSLLLDGAAAVPINRFDDDKHVLKLVGRALNAVDELGVSRQIASDRFKAIVTGDPLLGRDVYSSSVEFRSKAQHVFATNKLPRFDGGMDRGVRRRLLVLRFDRVIPVDERIEDIGRRAAAEDPDLALAWLVEGACRLMKNREFTIPESSVQGLREWLFYGDVVLAWLEDQTERAEGVQVIVSWAHRAFRHWAIHEGYHPNDLPDSPQFAQRLYAAGRGIRGSRTGENRYLVGMRLKGQPMDDDTNRDGA